MIYTQTTNNKQHFINYWGHSISNQYRIEIRWPYVTPSPPSQSRTVAKIFSNKSKEGATSFIVPLQSLNRLHMNASVYIRLNRHLVQIIELPPLEWHLFLNRKKVNMEMNGRWLTIISWLLLPFSKQMVAGVIMPCSLIVPTKNNKVLICIGAGGSLDTQTDLEFSSLLA